MQAESENPNDQAAQSPSPDKRKADSATRRKSRLTKFLSRPLVLEEVGPPAVLSHLLVVTSGLLLVGIGWSAVANISETAVTSGQIMPASAVQVIQHLEGGIVDQVFVENGQFVNEGDPLIRLAAADAQAELQQLQAREGGLTLRAERLRAFVLGGEPTFSRDQEYPQLAADQQAIFKLQVEAREGQRSVIQSRIEQRKSEIAGLEKQQRNVEKQLELISEQVDMRKTLLQKGLDSRVNYLEVQRTHTQVRGELVTLIGNIATTQEALNEAKSSLIELDANLRNEALNEMGQVTNELAQVRETMAELHDRVSRLDVFSPATGIIKGLATQTVGGVIGPGEPMMEVVPVQKNMVAEVQILPQDIGHIRIGQPAKVKVTTYDVARFGALEGILEHISASTFQDEQGEPYYKGTIALQQNHLGNQEGHNLVLPGMVVAADINTGKKTVLEYLLKPVYRAFDLAFEER
ncbi:MAG: HlyD family type I secretion periplasmic adaptor subunit [Pseudomonadota bacterium]